MCVTLQKSLYYFTTFSYSSNLTYAYINYIARQNRHHYSSKARRVNIMGQAGSSPRYEPLYPKEKKSSDGKKNEQSVWKEYTEKYSTNTFSAPGNKGYERFK